MPVLHWKFRSLNSQNAMKKSKINFSKWYVLCSTPNFPIILYLKLYFKSSLFVISCFSLTFQNKLNKCFYKNFYINICFSTMILWVYYIQQLKRIQLPNTKEYVSLVKKVVRTLCKFAFLKSRRDVSLEKVPETYYFRFPFMIKKIE